MLIEILGSAAGGGFPQWNCACPNCLSLRNGTFRGKARTQLQVAVRGEGEFCFLLNASPDVRAQIEANPRLHPRHAPRHSPISGVVLTGADLDQVLGLLLLREWQPLQIYAAASVGRILREDNSMFGMLHRAPEQAKWNGMVPGARFELRSAGGEGSGIFCEAFTLGTRYPSYVAPERVTGLVAGEAALGLILESASGRKLAFLPTVPAVDSALLERLAAVEVLLFDGTFWSDRELIAIHGSGQTARQMGHIPVSSEEGSLRKLAGLRKPRKIFVHINNTNPMLDESGPEHRAVRQAGWEVAEDGWQFEL
jgi:pyrroloquinoline quinone biosynthesis protein B